MMRSIRRIGVIAAVVLLAPLAAWAQTIGTFRWQTQPFCNVIAVTISIAGPAFRLEGTDDHCGATTKASVIGMAFPNADGSIGVGLTIVAPGAAVLHLDATIVLTAGFNGTWRDTVGRNGTWLFTPGAGVGGPVRPIVGPLLTYGSAVVQPTGASDRGLSATVTADIGAPNDAAGVYGRFGAPTSLASAAPAGVRGDSDVNVGVYGLSTTGFGVVGGAHTGVGVQGYAVAGAGSIGVQAVHTAGGTALEIYNGSIRVAGTMPTAFVVAGPPADSCSAILNALTDGDPNALLFVTPQNSVSGGPLSLRYSDITDAWLVCNHGAEATGPINVLVIKR